MTADIDLKELTLAELEDLVTAWGQTRFRARQILKWVYKGVTGFEGDERHQPDFPGRFG